MGKKDKMFQSANNRDHAAVTGHAEEYRIIKFDLIKVIILNIVYLAVILSLYYSNQNSQFLERWFAKILHF